MFSERINGVNFVPLVILLFSIVLVEKGGEYHLQSDAVLRISQLLGGPVRSLLFPGIFVPKVQYLEYIDGFHASRGFLLRMDGDNKLDYNLLGLHALPLCFFLVGTRD